jgi:hypothetical protein
MPHYCQVTIHDHGYRHAISWFMKCKLGTCVFCMSPCSDPVIREHQYVGSPSTPSSPTVPAPEIPLSGLNGHMTEQELDLLQLTAG